MDKREKCCSIFLLVLGLILLIAGIAIVVLMPWITVKLVDQEVPLRKNSFVQRTWQDPPFKITMQFWIFNITNPLAILHLGAKPNLVQKGPYGYRETQNKKQVEYEDDKISYVNQKVYYFDPSLSCSTCREDDIFTIPNVPYLSAIQMVDDLGDKGPPGQSPIQIPSKLVQMGAQAALMSMGEQLFVSNITAAQLLFDGYDDQVFDLAESMSMGFPDRMGLFYGRNNTDDGVYVIDSGLNNVTNIGQIISWKGQTDLSAFGWWNSSDANRIMGTDGTLYSPFLKRSDVLYTYISDVCRTLYLTYADDVDFKGIKAFRFQLDNGSYDDSKPENDGFCWPMKQRIYDSSIQRYKNGGWCLPSGMNDISRCQFGAPIVTSMPQFVYSPDEVRKSVTGLPDESFDYLSYIDIEPTTGVILRGARSMQLNVMMAPDPDQLITKNMKPVIVPLAWLNETVVIDEGTYEYLYQNVVTIRASAYIAAYAFIGVGLILIVCASIRFGISKGKDMVTHQAKQIFKSGKDMIRPKVRSESKSELQ